MRVCVRMLNMLFCLLIGTTLSANVMEHRPYEKYVDEISKDFELSMERQHALHCYASGGSMPNDVEKIKLEFICYKKMSVDEARKVEVSAVEELLQRINSHEKIRPYLREYPFTSDRVGVMISFRTETDDWPLDGSVALVFLAKSKIFYEVAEMRMSDPIPCAYMNEKNEVVKEIIPGKLKERLVSLKEETYEEALKLVQ